MHRGYGSEKHTHTRSALYMVYSCNPFPAVLSLYTYELYYMSMYVAAAWLYVYR